MIKNNKREKVIHVAIVLFILCLAIILRINNLEADPDLRISGDPGIFTDEGFYTASARNLVIFGKFSPNPQNRIVDAVDKPVYTYIHSLFFKIFEISIKTMRMPSIFYSIFILIITYFLVHRLFGPIAAVLSVFFLSFNYMFIQYNRLALLENLLILLMLLSIYFCLVKGETNRDFLFSGLLFGTAIITKGTAYFFLPAMLLSIILGKMDPGFWKKNFLSLAYFLFGVTVIIAVNKLHISILAQTGLLGENLSSVNLFARSKWLFEFGSIGDWFKSLTQILISRFSLSMPLIFFFAYFYSIWFFLTFKRPLSAGKRAELLFIMLIFTGIFFLSFFSYQPNRYRIPFIPFLCMLTAVGLSKLSSSLELIRSTSKTNYFTSIVFLGLTFLIFRILKVALEVGAISWDNNWILLLTIIIAGSIVLVLKTKSNYKLKLPVNATRGILPVFLILFLVINSYGYISWIGKKKYDIKEGNLKIKTMIKGGTIGGQYAPILCLESNNVAVPLFRENIFHFNSLKLTHYLDAVHHKPNDDFTLLNKNNPGFLKGAKLISEFPIGFTVASLYSLPYSD